jgi:hypothetical protein
MSARFMEEHMRRIHRLLVAAAFFILPASGFAETPPEASGVAPNDSDLSHDATVVAPSAAADELAWDQFDDPNFDPAAADAAGVPDATASMVDAVPKADAVEPEEVEVGVVVEADEPSEAGVELTGASGPQTSHGIVLGPEGIDDLGRVGRLHTVLSGDTLWDLSAAYLGTPWVWPSVWIDNDEIDDPHLIMPGDRIWITANEMRVVSAAEAESFLNPVISESGIVEGGAPDELPVVDPVQPLAAFEVDADDPSTLEAFPVAVPTAESASMASGRQITVSLRDAMGFVSSDDLVGASSIVDSPVERMSLAAGDPVILGLGEGDVEIGDQFTIFQLFEEVRDVETNRILGQHVEILGWLEVKELTGDTSIAEVRMSYDEFRRGARVMRRQILSRHVTMRSTPDAIEGKVVYLPSDAAVTGDGGYVYLNRGEFHGVEIGSELEVYDPGKIVNERSRRVDVRTPDHLVAKLVVVSVTPDTSVAFVLSSTREIEIGDDVRPVVARLAQR